MYIRIQQNTVDTRNYILLITQLAHGTNYTHTHRAYNEEKQFKIKFIVMKISDNIFHLWWCGYGLPQFLVLSISCDLLSLFFRLFSSSSSIRRDGIALSSANTIASSHFSACVCGKRNTNKNDFLLSIFCGCVLYRQFSFFAKQCCIVGILNTIYNEHSLHSTTTVIP